MQGYRLCWPFVLQKAASLYHVEYPKLVSFAASLESSQAKRARYVHFGVWHYRSRRLRTSYVVSEARVEVKDAVGD